MKKIISICAALVLSITMLTGCVSTEEKETKELNEYCQARGGFYFEGYKDVVQEKTKPEQLVERMTELEVKTFEDYSEYIEGYLDTMYKRHGYVTVDGKQLTQVEADDYIYTTIQDYIQSLEK